jgi:hypothetical protein
MRLPRFKLSSHKSVSSSCNEIELSHQTSSLQILANFLAPVPDLRSHQDVALGVVGRES